MIAFIAPGTAFLALLAGSPGGGSAEALMRRVQARHRSLVDLDARFVQSYRSGVLGREIVERGTVSIKAPGRMRWEYKEPEKKIFISDGNTCYFYVPADRQVIVRDQAGERGLAMLLLSGQRDILAEFDAAFEPAPPGLRRVLLTPRKSDPEVERLTLDVDEAARIRAIEVLDVQGNRSRFRFEALRENVGLPDTLFRFEIPRGTEVVAG